MADLVDPTSNHRKHAEQPKAGEWRETTLGEVLTLQRGFDLPKAKRLPGPYPVVASTGPVGTHRTAPVKGPGVVVGRSGSLGGGQFIKSDFWPLNTTLWVKDFRGSDRRFCYYLLKSLDLAQFNAGSGVPTLNRNHIHPIPVKVPSASTQHLIAHILGTLDDKIELNRRMNETLEEMARALFKSWFVDFDPVRAKAALKQHALGHDAVPDGDAIGNGATPARKSTIDRARSYLDAMDPQIADLFPDRLVDSELGEIPDGWEAKELGELANVTSGKRPGRRFPVENDEARIPLWGGNGPMGFVAASLVDSPILLTGRVGTLGSVFRITTPCWPSDNTLILTGKSSQMLNYLFFQTENIDFDSLNRGSTQPLLSQSDLKSQLVIVPPSNVLENFHDTTDLLFNGRDHGNHASLRLAAQRDILIPKLVSGDVRVADSDLLPAAEAS